MRNLNIVTILCTLFAVLLLSACQPIRPDQDMDAQAAQTDATADDQAEAAEPVTPTPAPPATRLTLQPPTAGEARSAAELFAAISPTVAFVETSLGTGSAVLIQDNYLLTNAHVVWPFTEVRVVFPDGSEQPAAPVAGWDLIADLALVGPVETQIEPLPLVDAGELAIGSDVYLVGYPFFLSGYPAEEEEFPQPEITAGILAQRHSWDAIGYTFYQVDGAATEDRSGVMVTPAGDVVGISSFTSNGFGLIGSVADALPRLNTILGHDLGVTIVQRGLTQGEGRHEFEGTLRGDTETRLYMLWEETGAKIEISVEGAGPPGLYAVSLGRGYWYASQPEDAEQKRVTLNLTVAVEEPYYIEVSPSAGNVNGYLLTSSHLLLAHTDPDDGRVLTAGAAYPGLFDLPGDKDVFELQLKAGQRVQIDVDSIGIDPWIALSYESDSLEEFVSDDDSGGGLVGHNSRIVYEAPQDGSYQLLVEDFAEERVGSYIVNITAPTKAAAPTELGLSRPLLPTVYGKMSWYESLDNGFSILEPIGWEPVGEELCPATACYLSSAASYTLLEIPIHEMPPEGRTREGYVSLLDEGMSNRPGTEKLSSGTFTTVQGLTADRLDFIRGMGGRTRVTVFVYVNEPAQAVLVLLLGTPANRFHESELLVELFLDSFRLWESDEREESAAFHLDEGQRLAVERSYEEALAAYARSIELNPGLIQAYKKRASLLSVLGRYEEALLDVDRTMELAPDDTRLIAFRGGILWSMGRVEDALAAMDRAISAEESPPAGYFNNRALMLSDIGEYEKALADIDRTIELNDGVLLPGYQDTRAYIYLSMGELEQALADYQALLDGDLRFAQALLGAGIVHGMLGNDEQAAMLVEEAMEQLRQDLADKVPDPQLAALLEMAAAFSGE